MSNSSQTTAREERRLQRLNKAFVEVCEAVAQGEKLTLALKRMRARQLRAPYVGYSLPSLYRLYFRWRRDPRPETLAKNYRPGKARVCQETLDDFTRRLRANPTASVREVYEQMRNDWRRGKRLPGIASWRGKHRAAPRFPVSEPTLRRHAAALLPLPWTEQRRRRMAALREIERLDAILNENLKRNLSHG